jgi:5-deoxy-glucuronate isomerase
MTGIHPWHHPAAQDSTDASCHVSAGSPLQWCGIDVISLAAGESHTVATGKLERAILGMTGAFTIEVGSQRFDVRDRRDVFWGISDWAYVGIDSEFRVTATTAAQVAITNAVADQRFEPTFIVAESIPVELRGAGQATRQINNFMSPDVFDGAHRLMCVEVLTPDGNWSSYPPHRHDGEGECVVHNEEIYYFRIGHTSGGYSKAGFGMHRTYTDDGAVDVNVPVYDGDVFLIPRGYHGPCVAAPGYPMYYLNVLAGPSGERTMAFCDDPAHHWVRDTWADMSTDPRLPMTSPTGPTGRTRLTGTK